MEKIITYENLRSFAYSNAKIIKGEINGIALEFFGLGGMAMYNDYDIEIGEIMAEYGIIYVVPYNNPWAWMNKQAVKYTDEILDVIFDKYKLDENTPIVSSGGSMGGQSALIYTAYAKRAPVACITNCPVCDVVYHFTEREDLPRTLYSALYNFEGTLDEALKSISPIHLVGNKLPRVRYHLFHCDKDSAVNIDKHSREFVKALEENGYDYTFTVVADRDHCSLTHKAREEYKSYIINEILR